MKSLGKGSIKKINQSCNTYLVASLVSDYGGQEQDNKVPHYGCCPRLEELATSTGNFPPRCSQVSAPLRRKFARLAKPEIFFHQKIFFRHKYFFPQDRVMEFSDWKGQPKTK